VSGPQDVALDIDSSRDVFSLYDDLSVLSVRHSALYFFYRTMLFIVRTMPSQDVCLSISLSVRSSLAGILSKRLNISSNFSHHSNFSIPNGMAVIQRGPITGALNARGV